MIGKVLWPGPGQDRSNFRWRISQTIKGLVVLVDPVADVDPAALVVVDKVDLVDGVALVVPVALADVVVVPVVDATIAAKATGCTKT